MTDKPQLDHDKDGKAGGSRPRLVWIVNSANGLHRVPTPDVDAAIADDPQGRRATPEDLAIAGITGPDKD